MASSPESLAFFATMLMVLILIGGILLQIKTLYRKKEKMQAERKRKI